MKSHFYATDLVWTGNDGSGTSHYKAYRRDHEVSVGTKSVVLLSSDPAFRGDPTRYNPEELLVASLSSCHLLWYLHLCAVHGVVVVDYRDTASGEMIEEASGAGQFTRVVLRPRVTVTSEEMVTKASDLHAEAHRYCFIARSVRFPVEHEPVVEVRRP